MTFVDDAAWRKLQDGKTYKIFKLPVHAWPFRYNVTRPSGRLLTNASTLRGAKRAIRREIERLRRQGQVREPGWWEYPIVHEEAPE